MTNCVRYGCHDDSSNPQTHAVIDLYGVDICSAVHIDEHHIIIRIKIILIFKIIKEPIVKYGHTSMHVTPEALYALVMY